MFLTIFQRVFLFDFMVLFSDSIDYDDDSDMMLLSASCKCNITELVFNHILL